MSVILPDQAARGVRASTRRRHLLDVARVLFVDQGFHQTGIAQIAARSGIKVGQIYRDFESKEAIIAAICEEDMSAWLEEDVLARAVGARDTLAIRQWIARFGKQDGSLEECRLMIEIMAEAGRNARVAEIYRSLHGRLRACLTEALRALGAGVSPEAASGLIELVLVIGAGTMSTRVLDPEGASRGADAVAALLERELDSLVSSVAGKECGVGRSCPGHEATTLN